MARMFPQVYREDPESPSEGERLLYAAFAKQLDDRWLVFHRCPWLSVDPSGAAQDGEIDFVLARADLGVLTIEVKSGGIGFDARLGQWHKMDRSGRRGDTLDDPVKQAVRGKFALLDRLKNMPNAPRRWWALGHALAFPQITFETTRPDLAADIVLDQRSLPHLAAWAEHALGFWIGARPTPPGEEGLAFLSRLLGHSFEIASPLGTQIRESELEFARLTAAQYSVLDGLARYRRVVISGCAGSGKTLLSLEKARRLADQGFRVLWVCYNRQLRDSSRRFLEGWSRASAESFHELALRWARKAGIAVKGPRDDPKITPGVYYNETLPGVLADATRKLPDDRYDAVIVDEGQDFKASYWRPLELLLRNRTKGIFYVFHDDNQALYNGEIRLPRVESRYDLTENLRNTRRIHDVVAKYYTGDAKIHARGPAGRKPEVSVYRSTAELLDQVERAIRELTTTEKVSHQHIVVLTSHGKERSAVWRARSLAGHTLVEGPAAKAGEVRWSSIHGFKGLEGAAVILAEVESLPHARLDTLLYVGCSRARHHLRIIASEEAAKGAKLALQ